MRIRININRNIFNKSTLRRTKLILLLLAIVSGIFAGGFYVGKSHDNRTRLNDRLIAYSEDTNTVGGNNGDNLDFNLYWEVWDRLKTNYVDKIKVTDQDLFYGSLKGLAEATGDPYTVFMDPKDTKDFADEMAGTFEGIGAEVGLRSDIITVIAPLDGTPAQKAGLRAGDKIYAVDNEPTFGLTVDEVVKKIRGPKDTKVTLTIIRGKDKPKDLIITRAQIIIKSVKTEMRSDGIMVIRISSFGDDTENSFNQAVNTALLKNPKGIILDLRNNPGGYLEGAINLASEWIDAGPIVAEQLADNKRNEYFSNGKARLKSFPTMVLINGGSASASEILAGALRDYKKATLIGETTFGKGSVQNLSDLSGGSSLKVTVAKWLTPAGDFINEKGIKPDIEVKMSSTDIDKNLDPQLNKALELLKKKK